MAKDFIEVDCPCCRSILKIDTVTGAVLSHKQPEKPPPIEDLAAAVANLKGDAARREEIFQKSFADHNNRKSGRAWKVYGMLVHASAPSTRS